MTDLFNELKRRNVFKVGVMYIIVAWLLMQVVDVVFPVLEMPDWTMKLVMLLLMIGFPIAVIFAWAFEMTPDGIKRDADVDHDHEDTEKYKLGRKLDAIVIAVLFIAVAVLIYERFKAGEAEVADLPPNLDRSVAVLPFVNMSEDEANVYFSDGVSEEILNVLAGIDGLRVAARTSSFKFRGEGLDIPQIAQQLNVAHVLEGSVRKMGNRVRITAQLIKANDGFHLWSETYDRDLDDIFAIQDEIARAIGAAMQLELMGNNALADRGGTDNLEAYEMYLQGRHHWRRRNATDLFRAMSFFERAVEIDPDYADAWTGLGAVGTVIITYSPEAAMEIDKYRDISIAAADKAIALDPGQAEAYAVKGNWYSEDLRWQEAIEFFLKALDIDPKNATAHHWLGLNYEVLGLIDKGIEHMDIALELDPLNAAINASRAILHATKGEYRKAIPLMNTARDLGWGFTATEFSAIYHAMLGEYQKSAELFASMKDTTADSTSRWGPAFIGALKDPTRLEEFEQVFFDEIGRLPVWTTNVTDPPAVLNSERYIEVMRNEKLVSAQTYIFSAWQPAAKRLRNSESFKQLTRDLNMLDYWQNVEWPDKCRPVGIDDFECD